MPSNRNKTKEFHQLMKSMHKKTHGQAKIYDYNPDNIDSFIVEIQPKKGLYQGGKFLFQINLGPYYPREPPDVICMTDIYHPNIDTDNFESHNICLNLFDEWNRSFGLEDVIQGIIFLFYFPNLRDPISHLFNLSLTQEEYEQNVLKSLQGGSIDGYPFQRNPGIDAPVTVDDEADTKDVCQSANEEIVVSNQNNGILPTEESKQNDDVIVSELRDQPVDEGLANISDSITTEIRPTYELPDDSSDFESKEASSQLESCDATNFSESQGAGQSEEQIIKASILFNDIEISLNKDYNESECENDIAKRHSCIEFADVSNHESLILFDTARDTDGEEDFDLPSDDEESLKHDRSYELCHRALIGRYSCSCSSDSTYSSDTEDDESHFTAESIEGFEGQDRCQSDLKLTLSTDHGVLNYSTIDEDDSTFTFPPLLLTPSLLTTITPKFGLFIASMPIFSPTRPLLLYPITSNDERVSGICLSWKMHPHLYCLISGYRAYNAFVKYFTVINSEGPLDVRNHQEVLFYPNFPLFLFGGFIRYAINRYLKSLLPSRAVNVNLLFVPEIESSDGVQRPIKCERTFSYT